jgi:hypothetical protein
MKRNGVSACRRSPPHGQSKQINACWDSPCQSPRSVTPIQIFALPAPGFSLTPASPRVIGSRISQRDFDSRFSQRLSVDESVNFSPSRHWRSSSMLSGPMRANTWGDSQST